MLARYIPKDALVDIEADLHRLGSRASDAGDLNALSAQAEAELPSLKQYDHWGRRVDVLVTSSAWKQLKAIAAEEGIVAAAYERRHGEHSRLHMFAKVVLFTPVSNMVGCPLSMTDGAARVLEQHGTSSMRAEVLPHLLSRDPTQMWTSGQWMTERPGGSDVGNTESFAEARVANESAWYSVHGFKWFSSATDSDITMLLARAPVDKETSSENYLPGSRGLSLFLARMRDETTGELNGVRVHRLKDKFGTKGLPTAELELRGMHARLIGQEHRGVPTIASILNITRVWCCMTVVANLRRSLNIAKVYATRRTAFGALLADKPAHQMCIANMEVQVRGYTQLAFFLAHLLGRSECTWERYAGGCPANRQMVDDERNLLRILTPVAKAFIAKHGCAAIAEAMEALGGQGYMEETGIGRLLRDALVNTIWEGTTNIMGLDVLRVLTGTGGNAYASLRRYVIGNLTRVSNQLATASSDSASKEQLSTAITAVRQAVGQIDKFLSDVRKAPNSEQALEASARALTFALGRVTAGTLLIIQAAWALDAANSRSADEAASDVFAAFTWCVGSPIPLAGELASSIPAVVVPDGSTLQHARAIAFGVSKL
ncbi:acyl-CoA dehydrogenase/oxidase C-terminal [Ramicandelaber brevisporus]|nr:acyl-CoA dehydrogenase/oxidase C-terminal [Ramicandelaber brevisporus]